MPKETYSSDAEEFLVQLAPRSLSTLTGGKRWIYRGQADASWGLLPSAFRHDTRFPSAFGFITVAEFMQKTALLVEALRKQAPPGDTVPDTAVREQAQTGLEAEALDRFFVAVDDAGLPLPDDSQLLRGRLSDFGGLVGKITDGSAKSKWPPLELRSILALAQHHGIPTRLLDWTHSSSVAAFFAARDSLKQSTDSLAVWALDWQQLQVENFLATVSDRLRERGIETAPAAPYRVRIVTAPSASNPNLRAQRGLFTLLEAAPGHVEPIQPLERTAEARPLDELDVIPLQKFVLPTGRATDLLRLLALDGVTAATVWPGYGGVVKSIRDASMGLGLPMLPSPAAKQPTGDNGA